MPILKIPQGKNVRLKVINDVYFHYVEASIKIVVLN